MDKAALAGDVEAPERQDVQMGLRASPQLRLAFDLVGKRYGISRRQIVELAPLLFTLMAEGCLAWRRECLKEVEATMDQLAALGKKSQLYFANYVAKMEQGVASEQESIRRHDLLGDVVRNDEWGYVAFHEDHLNAVTPFADYLCKLAQDLGIEGVVDFFGSTLDMPGMVGFDTIWGAEPYQVCNNDLKELAGGSEIAKWALAYGDAQLSKMPEELLSSEATKARIQWLESKVSDKTRDLREERERWQSVIDRVREERQSVADQVFADFSASNDPAAEEESR